MMAISLKKIMVNVGEKLSLLQPVRKLSQERECCVDSLSRNWLLVCNLPKPHHLDKASRLYFAVGTITVKTYQCGLCYDYFFIPDWHIETLYECLPFGWIVDCTLHLMVLKPNYCRSTRSYIWRSGSVSALPCERPGFGPRTCLREIILANNCTMQGQNNWGNWGSPGVMKLWVAWEVLRWLMKFRELCSRGFHPKLVTPPYQGFLNVNTPPNNQNSKRH